MKNTLASVALLTSCSLLSLNTIAAGSGDREITLQGSGTSSEDLDSNIFAATASYGMYTSDQSEWGIRQSVGVSDTNNTSSDWNGATRIFYDWNFGTPQSQIRPFIGASIGYIYGENVNETFTAGPEAGIKYYVNETTFVGLSAEYQFLFEDSDDVDNTFDDGAFFYGLGVGFTY